MPPSQPVKLVSDGELAELRAQRMDLLDRGWIRHSSAGHAAAAVTFHLDKSARSIADKGEVM